MRIGSWWIHPYTLKVNFGVLVALFVLWWRTPRFEIERDRLRKRTWIIAIAAVLGGRLGYVIGNSAYFVEHPVTIFHLDRVGGVHGGSAMVGGLAAVWIWVRVSSLRFRTALDFLAPAVLCVAASAWWGCADVGCAWGQAVLAPSGWVRGLVVALPDIYRVVEPRYAVQFIGAIWALLLALLAFVRREWGSFALAMYLLGTAGLTFLRADTVPQLGALRSDSVLNLTLAGVVFATILLDIRKMSISEPSRS